MQEKLFNNTTSPCQRNTGNTLTIHKRDQNINRHWTRQEIAIRFLAWFSLICVLLLYVILFTDILGCQDEQSLTLDFSDQKLDAMGGHWRNEYENYLLRSKSYAPEQIHLSLGLNHKDLIVTWSTIDRVDGAFLQYCIVDNEGQCLYDRITTVANISTSVVTESDANWIKATRKKERTIFTYRALLHLSSPETTYVYRAVSEVLQEKYFSKAYKYTSKDFSNTNRTISLALYGDLGLLNGQSLPRLTEAVNNELFDLIIHNGDFAYDLNTHHGQYGDEFMRMIEPIAARVPYQTSVGNHEIAENFTHYNSRFTMFNSGGVKVKQPRNFHEYAGQMNNFYYSFNVGPIHFVAFSTEFYYFLETVGMEPLHNQYEWLKKDLKHATTPEERALRPWIIVFGHRPMYCSSRDRDDCSKDSNILRKGLPFTHAYALEKMFYEFGVDVEFYSHEHQYERFLPLYDSKVYNGTFNPNDPYENPLAPVHIISGSAGCQERLDPFEGKPATGSVKQVSDYGYTVLEATRCELRFTQVSDDQQGVITDDFIIKKRVQSFGYGSGQNFNCNSQIN